MIRRSRFLFDVAGDFETTISVKPWTPGNEALGGVKKARSGRPASYVVRRDKTLDLVLRIREDQYDAAEALIEFGQSSQTFTWLPEATDPLTSFVVYLDAPAPGVKFQPSREDLDRIMDLTITIRSADGSSLWTPYFDPAYVPAVGGGGGGNGLGIRLDDLLDVDTAAAAEGDVLERIGGYWVPRRGGLGQSIPVSRFGARANGTDQWPLLQEWAEYPYDHPSDAVRTLYLDIDGVATSGDPLFGNLGQGVGYAHAKPIVVPVRMGLRMLGGRQNRRENYAPGSRLWPSFAYGWPLVFDDGQRQPDLVPSILGGPGTAIRRKNTYTNEALQYIRLRDAATLELNGLTALTIEYFYQYNGGSGAGWVLSSYGRRFLHELPNPLDNTAGAFICSIVSGFPWFDMMTTAGHLALHPNGDDIQDGNVHHVSVTWNGARACMRVDGHVTAEQNHGGTLLQDPGEEVNFGYQYSIQPAIFAIQGGPMGTYESMRISDSARYAVTGDIAAPTARFMKDSHTLALLNVDDNVRCALLVDTKDGDFWAYMQGVGDPSGTGDQSGYLYSLGGLEVDGISIDGDLNPAPYGGARTTKTCGILISAPGMYGVDLSHLTIARTRCGLRLGGVGNAYDLMARRILVNNGWGTQGRYGAESPNLTGLSKWEQCWMQGGEVPFSMGAGSARISGMHIEADQRTIFSMLLRSDDVVEAITELARVTFSVEGGVSAAYRANLGVDGSNAGITVRGSATFQSNNSDAWSPPLVTAHVPMLVAGAARVHLDAPGLSEFGGAGSVRMDELVTVAPDFTGRVTMRNPSHALVDPHPPSSLTHGAVTIIVDGTAIVPFDVAPELDASEASTFELTLTGPSSPTIINLGDGQRVRFRVIQDLTGGRALTWPANVKGGAIINGSAPASSVTQQEFEYDGTYLRALAAATVT